MVDASAVEELATGGALTELGRRAARVRCPSLGPPVGHFGRGVRARRGCRAGRGGGPGGGLRGASACDEAHGEEERATDHASVISAPRPPHKRSRGGVLAMFYMVTETRSYDCAKQCKWRGCCTLADASLDGARDARSVGDPSDAASEPALFPPP